MSLKLVITLLGVLTIGTNGSAETRSERLAQQAYVMSRAFECHYYAKLTREGDADRFFEIGIDAGREHIQARLRGRITEGDIFSKTPAFIGDFPPEVGVDFVLGGSFQYVQEYSEDQLNKMIGMNWWDCDCDWREVAREISQEKGCILLQ